MKKINTVIEHSENVSGRRTKVLTGLEFGVLDPLAPSKDFLRASSIKMLEWMDEKERNEQLTIWLETWTVEEDRLAAGGSVRVLVFNNVNAEFASPIIFTIVIGE